jgi:spore protease
MGLRTDLAIETREMYHESHDDKTEIPGVKADVINHDSGISVTRIEILDEEGACIMGKPVGNYITIEAKDAVGCEADYRKKVAHVAAGELRRLVPFDYYLKVLVAGLGNEKITPDSLGPVTLDKVRITRHYFIMFEEEGDDEMSCVSGFNPGVMGTTGIESAELIRNAAEISKPDVIIAIDSLAARNIERINSTIQISDTGISPGAGTGNLRKALNKETTGVKVIAIGIPTVIDAKSIIMDTMEKLGIDMTKLEESIDNEQLNMIVTSSEIDQVIKDFSDIISDAINITVHPGVYS